MKRKSVGATTHHIGVPRLRCCNGITRAWWSHLKALVAAAAARRCGVPRTCGARPTNPSFVYGTLQDFRWALVPICSEP
jgi:hypothetical protein